jgi:hypothetical protein
MEVRFWPFPITKPEAEWDEFERDYLDFMRSADTEGYQPREEGAGTCVSVGEWSKGRSASLVFRGRRNGWEPFLGEWQHSVRLGPSYGLPLGENACVCVRPPFRDAAHFALEWMRGQSLESLLSNFEFVGGLPAGIVLRAEAVRLLQR